MFSGGKYKEQNQNSHLHAVTCKTTPPNQFWQNNCNNYGCFIFQENLSVSIKLAKEMDVYYSADMFSLWLTLFIQIFLILSLEWFTEALNNQEPGTYFLYSTVTATYMCQRQLSGSMFPSAALIPPCGAKQKQ